jgi:hypothetical protein
MVDKGPINYQDLNNRFELLNVFTKKEMIVTFKNILMKY